MTRPADKLDLARLREMLAKVEEARVSNEPDDFRYWAVRDGIQAKLADWLTSHAPELLRRAEEWEALRKLVDKRGDLQAGYLEYVAPETARAICDLLDLLDRIAKREGGGA